MDDPTSRRLQLLGMLQARPEWPGLELAEQLGVSPRTLRRDVARLRDLGYTIDSEAGSDGGYRLAQGTALPPLTLGDDEAVAVAVGLRAAVTSGVTGLDDAAVCALTKLETVLPTRLRTQVRALGADTVHLAPGGGGAQLVDPDTLAVVALACRRGERLQVAYRSRTGDRTRRAIDPHRLVRTSSHWYLVARDVAKDAWRTLRVDRISGPQPLGAPVQVSDPPDPATLVAEAVTFGPHESRVIVRLGVPADRAQRLVDHPLALRPDDDDDRATIVELGGDEPWWTARYLVSLACPFEVIEGDTLARELQRLADELTRSATGPKGPVPPSGAPGQPPYNEPA